jgi:HlyD family secretion protein
MEKRMNIKRILTILFALSIAMIGLSACNFAGLSVSIPAQENGITASGTIDADTVRVASELSGRINHLSVIKGGAIQAGDIMFQLDDALLQAKYEQVKAQVAQAEAAVDLARQNQASAEVQYQLALDTSRTNSEQFEAGRWEESTLNDIELPNWYFQKSETIDALRKEVDDAQTALDEEQKSLQATLQSASNKDFVDAEKRLNQAQIAFKVADQTLDQAEAGVGDDRDTLTDAAQKLYDQAQAELDAAQKAYDAMLTDSSADDVKEARAKVAVAKARLENAQDALDAILTREDSYPVETAKIAVDTAIKAVAQAEANLAAVQASQHELEVQLGKMTVSAPVTGVVLSNPVKTGEVVAAGATVYEVGALDNLKLTVYVTEDQFGKVKLGDQATVTVDSYSGETFKGKVVYISNEAEFTPRNIQTVESRSTTVYAVEISLPNPELKLKPGMPADATIIVGE